MKKVLSFVLVIAMVLSSMSFAFASTSFEDVTGNYENAVNALVSLDVIDGYEDGTFRPERTITRAEIAKVLVEALGYGKLVGDDTANFSDTKGHWADGYIAVAAGASLVTGYPDGSFKPDQAVTYSEALTMVVRSIGYTDEFLGGTWPTNFKTKAIDLDLTDDVVMSTSGADRGGVAQIIYNALEVELVTINSDGDSVNVKTGSRNKLFIDNIAEYNEKYKVTTDKVDPGNKNYAGELVYLTPYIYQSLEVYLNDDDQVVYIKDTNSLVYEGDIDDIYESGEDVIVAIEQADSSIKKVKFADVTLDSKIDDSMYLNGWETSGVTYEELLNDTVENVKIVANDEDGNDDGSIQAVEVQGFVVTERTEIVRVEKTYVKDNDSIDGIDLPIDENDDVDLRYIKVMGEAESLEEIEVDDIVVAYASDDTDYIMLVVSRDTIEGKVTRLYDSDTIYIDGKAYDIATLSLEDDFDLGDEGVFYLDHNGEIADYDGESAGPEDYAVIIGISEGKIEKKFGKISVDDYPEIKLATQDDEEVVYEVDVEVDEDEKDGIDDSAQVYKDGLKNKKENLIVAVKDTDNDGNDLEFNPMISKVFEGDSEVQGILVKYELDSDGRISEIEIIKEITDGSFGKLDLDLSKNKLTDGAIVFNADEDFEVVDVDDLNADMDKAYAYRNDKGEIEVLIAGPGEVDNATDTIFAFVGKISLVYNESGKKVNQYVIYTDGQKKEIMSDDDTFASVVNRKYAIGFEYDGDVIDSDKLITKVSDLKAYSTTATAIDVNESKGLIKLEIGTDVKTDDDVIKAGDIDWFALSDHATVVKLDDARAVDKLGDLYDIKKGDVISAVYFNADGEIDLIVIDKYDNYNNVK